MSDTEHTCYAILPLAELAKIRPDPHTRVRIDLPLNSPELPKLYEALYRKEALQGGVLGLQGEWRVEGIMESPDGPAEVTLVGKERRE